METVLEARGLCKRFGAVVAAEEISVGFQQGEVVGMVGANGAGKTTFVNMVTGYVKPDRGRILYRGQDISAHPPRLITRMGITRSFQIPQLYLKLTVLENVLLALATGSGQSSAFWTALKTSRRTAEALHLLEQFQLQDDAMRAVDELPEGSRKILDIAMSFALKPSVLLLDEPTSGVSVEDKFDVMDTLIGVLKASGITTLFVEHDMEVVERYAERMLAFVDGKIIADGEPKTLLADKALQRAVTGLS